jgi:protein SCO1/2
MRNALLIWITLMLTTLPGKAQLPVQPMDPEIGIEEKLEDTIPGDLPLVNHRGEKVLLGDLVDKPTVISFVYYRCPGICSPLMSGIAEVIDKTGMRIGQDYQVFTISFDPREGTDLASGKHRNYLNLMTTAGADTGWTFFTADSATIKRITSAAGFHYKPTGNDFVHAAALIVISPDRKITRYLNGTYFQPFEFKMALIEASKGQSGPTINRVLQFCYSYDPQGKQYVLSITRVTGILISLIAIMIFLGLTLRPLFRKKQRNIA